MGILQSYLLAKDDFFPINAYVEEIYAMVLGYLESPPVGKSRKKFSRGKSTYKKKSKQSKRT